MALTLNGGFTHYFPSSFFLFPFFFPSSSSSGVLSGTELDAESNRHIIPFKMFVSGFGLLREIITVHNLMCPSQVVQIPVTTFVPDGVIDVDKTYVAKDVESIWLGLGIGGIC